MSYWCSNCGNMASKPMSGMNSSKFCTHCQTELTKQEFEKAREALRKAHVPGPYYAVQAP